MSDEDFFWDGIEDDEDEQDEDQKFLIVHVANRSLAIPQQRILSMMVCPPLTPVPETPPWNPGIIKVREQLFPVIDLRIKLGLPSFDEETKSMVKNLEAREEDHVVWMQELVHCVESGKEFTLSRDHHDCPFGQWHDQFQTQNILLKSEVEKMGPPHKAIHRLADEALFIRDKEGVEGALTYIERNKTLTLDKLLFLFQRTKDLLLESKRSIAILMSVDKEVALLVDRVENFIPLLVEENAFTRKNIKELPLGKRQDQELVYPILTGDWVLNGLEYDEESFQKAIKGKV